ncbi:DUF2812 domain-containing protein [Brotaphodocola sp.]|uniref:DUF2812 domain-containing protein n=1 Tax=Brotaphodocola sp. TaxID=3073577 RepID=UPI003D7E6265
MRKEKQIWWNFSVYEADLFEHYLEEQALLGWFPEKIGNFGMKFYSGEPERRSYATVIIPGTSTLTGVDSWAERKFQERCEDAGWKFQCRGINWQVFYTTDVSVKRTEEMSRATQFEIQKSMVWGWSTRILYPVLILAECWVLYRSLKDPAVVLSDPFNFLSVMMTTILAGSWAAFYVRLMRWAHREKESIRNGEKAPIENFNEEDLRRQLKGKKFRSVTWVFLILLILSAVCAISLQMFISYLVSVFLLLGIVLFMRRWIRKNGSGNSREDWIGYFVGVVVISMIAFPLCNVMIEHFTRAEKTSQTETGLSNFDYSNEKHTVFASCQTGDMRVNGAGNPVGVMIYKSPIPWVISQTRKNYPKDMTDLWEQREQDLPKTEMFLNLPEDVSVSWCRYTFKNKKYRTKTRRAAGTCRRMLMRVWMARMRRLQWMRLC